MEQNIEIVKDFYILDSVQYFFWHSPKLLHIDFFFSEFIEEAKKPLHWTQK